MGVARSTAQWGFVPIWTVREANAVAVLKGNPFDDAIISWPVVIGLAAAILLAGSWGVHCLRDPRPASTDPNSDAAPLGTMSKVIAALLHGITLAAVYLGVKHFTRGLETADLWKAAIMGAAFAIVQSLPWSSKKQREP